MLVTADNAAQLSKACGKFWKTKTGLVYEHMPLKRVSEQGGEDVGEDWERHEQQSYSGSQADRQSAGQAGSVSGGQAGSTVTLVNGTPASTGAHVAAKKAEVGGSPAGVEERGKPTHDSEEGEWGTVRASVMARSTDNPIHKLVDGMRLTPNPELDLIALSIGVWPLLLPPPPDPFTSPRHASIKADAAIAVTLSTLDVETTI